MSAEEETFAFSADINQLLSLIINTFYSNKEIFLRELISNASDALDKIRVMSLSDGSVLENEARMEIRLIPDAANGTLTIEDTGIGMSKADLIKNLGTKSGTSSFMETLTTDADNSMIGQFGVGFFSSYLVADEVVVTSKNNEDKQHTWRSAGGEFTVHMDDEAARMDLGRGTRICLQLREDMKEYLEERRLKDLVKKHFEFIGYPIKLYIEKTTEKEVSDDEEGENKAEPQIEHIADQTEKKEKKKKTVKEVFHDWESLNGPDPIWMRKAEDVSSEEYGAFYRSLTNDWEDHAAVKHFSVEGQLDFRSVLFVPCRAPFDTFKGETKKNSNALNLYIKRVFIMDNWDIMPEWLGFIKGVVESEDLPLNIAHLTLHQNKILHVIKKNLIKRSIELINELAEDDEKYKKFYEEYSMHLKLGICEDPINRVKIAKLLRYHSSNNSDEQTSLSDYVSRMSKYQKGIYYVTGESKKIVEKSPLLEKLVMKGVEVLYMVDPIDECTIQQLKEYEDKKFICASTEGHEVVTDEEMKQFEENKAAFEGLCNLMKAVLDEKVEKVIVSPSLQDSPCVFVPRQGWSAGLERIIKAQAHRAADSSMGMSCLPKKTMGINPSNLIIISLREKAETDRGDKTIKDLIWLLYDNLKTKEEEEDLIKKEAEGLKAKDEKEKEPLLRSGISPDEPQTFGSRIDRDDTSRADDELDQG